MTAPRVHAFNAYWYRQFDLDTKLLSRSTRLIERALEGGTHLTRPELAAVLEHSGIVASGPRLAALVMFAELEAIICSGPLRGKQHTYALLDERAPDARAMDPDEALTELTRRFFTARGPATLKDYLRWSSLTAATGRAGLEMVKPELEQEEVGDRTYWFPPSLRPRAARRTRVDLIQGYDEVVMSYSESKDVLSAHLAPDMASQARTVYLHAILLDGHLIGHWKPVRKPKGILVDAELYRPLDGDERQAFAAAFERYARFEGTPVSLRATSPRATSRRHWP